MKLKLPKRKKFKFKWDTHIPIIIVISVILVIGSLFSYYKISSLQDVIDVITQERDKNLEELQKIAIDLEELKNQDQIKRNEELQATISSIEKTYDKAVVVYDNLVEFRNKSKNTAALEEDFAEALSKLSNQDYSGATDTLNLIASKITQENVTSLTSL